MFNFKDRFSVSLIVRLACIALVLALSATPAEDDCDLSPITFSGTEFDSAIKYFVDDPSVVNGSGARIANASFNFGTPKSIPGVEHPVVTLSVHMDLDNTDVLAQWASAVKSQTDVGCSSKTIWFPNPPWEVDETGAWVGRFHVKQVVRACFYVPFIGDVQIDKATYEVDFWNRIAVTVSPDGRRITPFPTNGQSDNVSPLVKAMSQGIGAIGQILTLGFVPQQEIQRIDAQADIQKALQFIEQYERGFLKTTNAAGPHDVGFTLDFLFKKAAFRKTGNQLFLSLDSAQDEANLPSRGQACTIRETLQEMKTGGQMVGPDGKDYVTSSGDSYWNIAERFYGNGKFHLILAGENGVGTARMNHLVKGKKLRIDAISKLRRRTDLLLVMKGDSLWRIANQQKGNSYEALRTNNADWLSDPNIIYPVQFLRREAGAKKPVHH